MKKIMLFLLILGAITVVAGQLHDKALAKDPVTVTYDVWISPTTVGPPYAPFHDCLTLDYDGARWTMLLEGCGPAGPAWVTPPTPAGPVNSFGGTICGGASVLGWYMVGSPYGWNGDVIGGIMARWPKTWAFEGVRNDECTLAD